MMPTSPEVDWPAWSIEDSAALGRYIVPDVVRQHVAIPAGSAEAATTRLRAVWATLWDKAIGYAHEPPGAGLGLQRIRTPGGGPRRAAGRHVP